MTPKRLWTRLAALLALTALLAACGPAVTPGPTTSAPAPAPTPTERQATCDDSAIRLLDHDDAGVHGAIFADTLHMGGATAPATCLEPANQSLEAGLPLPEDLTAQVQQSRYYLIVIRYPGGNRLYVLSRRGDGTSCVVDTNDQCIARVTDLPDDFDLETLPDDVAPTIPAGRPAPPTAGPTPGDDALPGPGDDAPSGTAPPTGGGYTPPGDGAPPAAAGTPPGAAGTPQPSDGATGVTVGGPLLSWAAAPRALSYDVYWGAENTDLETPINTSLTALRIAASADLDADTLYYWRVDAKNEAGTTRGAVWSFTTATAPAPPTPAPAPPPAEEPPAEESPPGVPSNPQPRDGATGVTVWRTAFNWDAAPGACRYEFYFGTSQDLTGEWGTNVFLGDDLWLHTTEHDTGRRFPWFMNLAEETTYYWRVDAIASRCVAGELFPPSGRTRGDVWSFTTGKATGTLPGVSSNPQPSDGATDVRRFGTVTLRWDAAPGGVGYFVYVGTSQDLASDNIENSPFLAHTNGISFGDRTYVLSQGTTYYWRVDAKNEAGITQGDVWSFTTGTSRYGRLERKSEHPSSPWRGPGRTT